MGCRFNHDGVTPGQTGVILIVASADHGEHRNMTAEAMTQYQLIAFTHTIEGNVGRFPSVVHRIKHDLDREDRLIGFARMP